VLRFCLAHGTESIQVSGPSRARNTCHDGKRTQSFHVHNNDANQVRLEGIAIDEHLRDIGAAGVHTLQLLRTARLGDEDE